MGFNLGLPTSNQWAQYDRSMYSKDAQQFLDALPHPDSVNPKHWAALDPYSQQVALSGYSSLGFDPQQLTQKFSAELPTQGQGPAFGLVQ